MGSSLYNAIVSGRAGVALLTDGPAVYSLEPRASEPVARRPEEFHLLFGASRDFEFLEDAPCDEIANCLSAAIQREQALDLALTLLERDYDQDIRREAAEELDERLRDESVVQSLDSVMFSSPLPSGTDVAGAEAAVPPSCHDATRWLQRLRQFQPMIRLVHDAWGSLPDDVLPSSDRDEAEAACVRIGAFRRLVLAMDTDSDLGGVFVGFMLDPVLGRRLPNSLLRKFMPRWQAALRNSRPAALDGPAAQSREDEENSDADTGPAPLRPARPGKGGRSFDRVAAGEKANERVAQIAAQLKAGNLATARAWVDDLVQWHRTMYQGDDFACKSLCNLAIKAQELGLFRLQRELTERAIELNPDDGWAWCQHGQALLNCNNLQESLRAYDEARLFTSDPVAQAGRAEVLKAMGKFSEALDAYDQVRRDHPENVVAQAGRAEVLKAMGKFSQALDAYDQVRRDHPEDVVAQAGRAEVLKAMGQFSAALDAYDQVRRDHPENVVAQAGRAEVLKAMGQFSEALDAYDQVRRDHPENVVARTGLANLLAELGRYEEALQLIAGLPRISAQDWVAEHIRGMILLRQGSLDAAVRIFERGAAECPFGRSRAFFRTALATAALHLRNYVAAEAAVAAVEDEATALDAVESIRTHIFGLQEEFARAADSYQRLSRPTTVLASELFEELRRRFVDQQPAVHSDDWLLDRQIRFQMQCFSIAA